MPFSVLLQGYPKTDIPVAQVQGPMLQGVFLNLIQQVDPAVSERLHNDNKYRPYTLSPLGVETQAGTHAVHFEGFRLPRESLLSSGTPCYLRITLLEDALFPTFSRYFLERAEPTFVLGETEFVVTGVYEQPGVQSSLCTGQAGRLRSQEIQWSQYLSYAELIDRAVHTTRRISLRFLTPTSFRRGRVDFPLPDPRLVFQSYRKRFAEFYQVAFLPDFEEQVEYHTGISNLKRLETNIIRTKRVSLIGFTGKVTYQIDRPAPPDLVFQMNLLADYAFFCGTGQKTTIGLGQTVRVG